MNITTAEAIDLYIGSLARAGKARSTRATYFRDLGNLDDLWRLHGVRYVADAQLGHYELYLNRFTDKARSTLASKVSLCRGFSTFNHERGYTADDVARVLKRPRRLAPEDLAVVTVTEDDVLRMLDACEDWQEFICLATAVYLGARRRALANARRSDVDLVHGTVRFLEKGDKEIVKPIPNEYQEIIVEAERNGLWRSPEDWLIPNRRPASVKGRERSDKIVWETVKRVAKRAGVNSHVHALRAAFAVSFHEAHPGKVVALKDLMGHTRVEQTMVYLRRRKKAAGMEAVRDLSWGVRPVSGFPSQALKAHTGFEPVPASEALTIDIRRKLATLATSGVSRQNPERRTHRAKA
jgi:integrase